MVTPCATSSSWTRGPNCRGSDRPTQNLLPVELRRLLGAFNPRHRRVARGEHRPDRPPGDLQGAGGSGGCRGPSPVSSKMAVRSPSIEHRAALSRNGVADPESPSVPGRRVARRAPARVAAGRPRAGGGDGRWRAMAAPRMWRSVSKASGAEASRSRGGARAPVVGHAQHEQRIGQHQLARGGRAGDVRLARGAGRSGRVVSRCGAIASTRRMQSAALARANAR